MRIKKVLQTDLKDCGVACLMTIVNYYGGYVYREYLREITNTTSSGVSVYSLVECADKLGFEALAIKSEIENVFDKLPCIAHVIKNNLGHFVVVYKISSKTIKVMDPAYGFKTYTFEDWNKITTNVYILYKPINKILSQTKNNKFSQIIFHTLIKYKMTYLIILLFSFVYTFSEILISYSMKELININKLYLKYILILLILILILKELTNLFRNYLINYLNHIIDNTFIKEIYNHIIRLPYLYFKNRTKGDILAKINDVFKIRDLISKLFITVFIDLIFVLIILIFIFSIFSKIGYFTLFVTIIYILITLIYSNLLTKKVKKLKQADIIVKNHLIETLSSIETIKGMVIEDMQNLKLDVKYTSMQDSSFKLNKMLFYEAIFKNFVMQFSLILIIYLKLSNQFNSDLGGIFILYNLYINYFNSINNISLLFYNYKDAKLSYIRIKEILNIEIEHLNIDKKTINKKIFGNIQIKNLKYSYNGIEDVLTCKTLLIKSSSKVLLYGNSGEGKSTLMKLLNRYLNNYKGDILIDDRDIKSYNLLDIRKKITYLSNNEILYTDTIYNNITLNNKIDYSKYLEILKLCGVDKILKRSILGDEMLIENDGYNLSAGERQRIIIARSLIKNSDIYIFDEITSFLDIKSERILLEKLFEFLKNKTVIVISHRFNNRDLYQRFIMIKGGIVYDN